MTARTVLSTQALLSQMTPSEVIFAFADRFLPFTTEKRMFTRATITAERYVSSPELGALMAEVAVAALVDGGDVVVVERETRVLVWQRRQVVLQLSAAGLAGSRWPAESPEGRLLDWLRARRGNEAPLLREVFAEALIVEQSAGALYAPLNVAERSLARTGLTLVEANVSLLVFRSESVTVDQRQASELANAGEDEVSARLACRRALSAGDQERIRAAWLAAAAQMSRSGY